MGQVSKARRALTYMAGINQMQGEGLDINTREAACRAVKAALAPFAGRRDVFAIDQDVRAYERLVNESRSARTKEYYGREVLRLMEEMLSHGDTMGEFCGSS